MLWSKARTPCNGVACKTHVSAACKQHLHTGTSRRGQGTRQGFWRHGLVLTVGRRPSLLLAVELVGQVHALQHCQIAQPDECIAPGGELLLLYNAGESSSGDAVQNAQRRTIEAACLKLGRQLQTSLLVGSTLKHRGPVGSLACAACTSDVSIVTMDTTAIMCTCRHDVCFGTLAPP